MRLNVLLEDIDKVLLIKTTLQQLKSFNNAMSTSLFKHFKPSMHFFFSFSLACLNWVYNIIIRAIFLPKKYIFDFILAKF